ncbi:hypothetical protein N657DRAFT_670005, partial [Parathielavia appendiculata]
MASSTRPSWLTPEVETSIGRVTETGSELNRLSAKGRVPKFCYDQTDQLGPGWIRVIDLVPGAGDDPIICSLSQQALRGGESYEAV